MVPTGAGAADLPDLLSSYSLICLFLFAFDSDTYFDS